MKTHPSIDINAELLAGVREVEQRRAFAERSRAIREDLAIDRPAETPEEAQATEAELWAAALELLEGLGS